MKKTKKEQEILMQDGNAKQQVVEQVKGATNILVTVSSNPSVDELSAALGFTLMLNKMDKSATAVFSGAIPPAISFLQPDKTFENTVDSLRDFIIALDKEKADRLRYKVEDDVVRVFITPYRTTITEKDLQFSQGDFNVELIVALGVEKRDDLDKAIIAHGRILHDASVITINRKADESSLGGTDWHDTNASSLCEMLMSLSEALQPGLLDEQISTALLTGIVAATERFSNIYTTPRVMTMAAQLMAAGANQQLIATKLEEGSALPVPQKDGSTYLKEGASSRVSREAVSKPEPAPVPDAPKVDGTLQVAHESKPTRDTSSWVSPTSVASTAADSKAPKYDVEKELTERLNAQMPIAPPTADLREALDEETKQQESSPQSDSANALSLPPLSPAPVVLPEPPSKIVRESRSSWMSPADEPPAMSSPLSATTQQALEDAKRQDEQNHKYSLLSHDSGQDQHDDEPQASQQLPGSDASDFGLQFEEAPLPPLAASDPQQDKPKLTLADLEQRAHAVASEQAETPPQTGTYDVDQARQAVDEALSGVSFSPSNNPLQSVGTQELGSINHSEAPSFDDSQIAMPPVSDGDLPPPPPLPDFNSLPPLPESPPESTSPFIDPNATPANQVPPSPTAPSEGVASQQSSNPGQFRIPGQ